MAHVNNEVKNSADQNLVRLPYLKWDKQGNILQVTLQLCKKCEYSDESSFISHFKVIDNFFHYPSWDSVKSALGMNKILERYPVFIEKKDSQLINAQIDLSIDDDGNYGANIGIDSNNLNAEILKHSPMGIFVSTEKGKFLMVNQKLVEIYGHDSREEMLSMNDIASDIYFNPEDRKRLLGVFNGTEPDQKVEDFQFVAKQKEGGLIVISKNVFPVVYNEQLIYLFGYVKDISKSIEDVDSPLPNFKCALSGEIIHVNNAAANLLGYSQEELRSMKIQELYFDPQERIYWLNRLKKKRNLYNSPRLLRKKNGDRLSIFTNVSILTTRIGNNDCDVCIKGWLSLEPGGPVNMTWIENFKTLLASDEYELNPEFHSLSINAVCNVAKELNITYLSDSEVHRVVESLESLCSDFEKSELLISNEKYKIKERIELDVWHSLEFFSFRDELLRHSYTVSQASYFLGISEKEVIKNFEGKCLLAIDKDGELLFPIWQFNRKETSGILENLSNVLTSLEVPDMSKLSWLTNPNKVLDGHKPCDVLKSGTLEDKQRVIAEASRVSKFLVDLEPTRKPEHDESDRMMKLSMLEFELAKPDSLTVYTQQMADEMDDLLAGVILDEDE